MLRLQQIKRLEFCFDWGKCQFEIAKSLRSTWYRYPKSLFLLPLGKLIKTSQPSTLYLVFELQMFSIHVIKFDAQDYELYSLNACQW